MDNPEAYLISGGIWNRPFFGGKQLRPFKVVYQILILKTTTLVITVYKGSGNF